MIKILILSASLLITSLAQAALITTNEADLDSIFSQATLPICPSTFVLALPLK